MRRSLAFTVRAVVLAAAFCALGGAAGCGRQAFDLLASAGSGGSVSGVAGAGAGNAAGAGGLVDAGVGGLTSAGAAGRPNFPGEGGSGGNGPCLSAACMDGGLGCPVSIPFCTSCVTSKDCDGDSRCDSNLGRCVQCRHDQDCAPGLVCNVFTMRCAKPCKTFDDCDGDPTHRFCHPSIGVCVSCTSNTDCALYGHSEDRCYLGACAECFEDHQCTSDSCIAGRCQKPH